MFPWNCCRICLGVESLNPIFSIRSQSKMYTETLLKITGIKIQLNDSYPQEICAECTNFVNQCTKFRRKAESTQKTLAEKSNNHLFDIKTEPINIFNTNESKIAIIDISDFSEYNDSTNTCSYEVNYDDDVAKTEMTDDNTDSMIEFVSEIQHIPEKSIEFIFDTKKLRKRVKNNKIGKTKTPTQKRVRNKKLNLENNQQKENTDEITTNEHENRTNTESQDQKTRVKEKIECEYCHKILTSKLSLRNHHKIHTGFDVVCEHCGKKFITRRLLLMHCRAKHGYEKTDKCSYCDYTASNAEQVKERCAELKWMHKWNFGSDPSCVCGRVQAMSHITDDCPLFVIQGGVVKIHERLHTGEKPYACQQCGAGFHRKSSYLQHVAIHLPEKTVQCKQCPALFKSVTLMRIHASRHKQPSYQYRCRVCAGAFARRRNVVRHLQRIHALAAAGAHVERVKIA